MSASGIRIITVAFPDTANGQEGGYYDLSSNVSFLYPISHSIRTLSTNGAHDNPAKGLLYVPDLSTDGCKNATMGLISQNATRRANLPDDYNLIGFAPWTEKTCVKEFLDSTLQPHQPVSGFIFYLPDDSTDTPPMPNDEVWGLDDGGAWKRDHPFPVWAVPGAVGGVVMQQLGMYSGNVTEVPNGHDLAGDINPSEYVRLYALVDLETRNPLPSLWVFLLITLGLLILIVAITSIVMHILQRRRRQALRERVINGEVDLEALGVKRLTVPQEILDKMPVYKYRPNTANAVEPAKEYYAGAESIAPSESMSRRNSDPTGSTLTNSAAFSQPTCAICLDDFELNETEVRELPCRHIFHPECVDTFLLNNSSLCPMCKNTTLPRGYCPTVITNAMVRRERVAQRRRERDVDLAGIPPSSSASHEPITGPSAAVHRAWTGGRRFFSAPAALRRNRPTTSTPNAQASASHNDIEMGAATIPTTTTSAPTLTIPHSSSSAPVTCPPPSPTGRSRREWARIRAIQLLGTRRTVEEEEEEERRNRGSFKKLVARLFPG